MNIDNEVLINAFKEEMARSNHDSKWWNDHLSEQITNLFGQSLDASIKDQIMSSAKAYINSGTLATSQYFYSTKELSDKKEIFASANKVEQNNLFNQITLDDKQSVINNNEHLKIENIYELLTAQEIEYNNKAQIANLLDDSKIRELKENHNDLDELLKTWLGERYTQIFGKEEIKPKEEPKQQEQVNDKEKPKKDIMGNFFNASNKILFFNSINNMKDKQELFSKLSSKEKSAILNDKDTEALKAFYNNYPKKDELLGLMNNNTLQSLYKMSGVQDKDIISNHLYKKENKLNNIVNQNISNITKEKNNINKYYQEIDKSKVNIVNLKNDKKETKLNIKTSKVTIKQLNKRRAKLEKKLTNSILNKDSRISFISKKRLAKLQRITNEINLVDNSIDRNNTILNNYEQKLDRIETSIRNEKNSINDNRNNIRLSSQNINDYAKDIRDNSAERNFIINFHKSLVGKKIYNQNKNSSVMLVPQTKASSIANTYKKAHEEAMKKAVSNPNKEVNTADYNKKSSDNKIVNFVDYVSNKDIDKINKENTSMALEPNKKGVVDNKIKPFSNDRVNKNTNTKSNTSQSLSNMAKEVADFNKLGIDFNVLDNINPEQTASYLPQMQNKIASMTSVEAQMAELCFKAVLAEQLIKMFQLQQQMKNGRARTLSKAGFSNVLILLLSLTVLTLTGLLILVVLK